MIFEEQISRKPDYYPWTKDFINSIQDGHWTEREFNFQSDIQDFKTKLSEQEKEIIVKSLATIANIESGVKVWWSLLGRNLPHPSLVDMGFIFAANEVVHSHAYSKLLEVLGLEKSFEDILKLDIIKGRSNYLTKHNHKYHSDNKKQFIYSMILFSIFIENISLFSQFYTVMFFGKFKNYLKDTNKQVEYTSREEFLHFSAGAKIVNVLRKEHPELFDAELEEKIIKETEQAVNHECKIIDWILGDYNDDKLNPILVKEFIKGRLNDSLKEIGYKKIFKVDKDIIEKTKWFDELVFGNNMTDFFSSKPSEYSKGGQSFNGEDLF